MSNIIKKIMKFPYKVLYVNYMGKRYMFTGVMPSMAERKEFLS